jgi:hypothetical protein
VFAGAAREVVFSNREVVQRIQKNFVPVALKAAHINVTPRGVEGRLYAEIGRSKPAPQGICVANSSGKALVWALSFDDEDSIIKFLDYAAERYRQFPDATKPVATERFMRFPSQKLPDVPDTRAENIAPAHHAEDDRCSGLPKVERGTLVGRVIGRALQEDGSPVADTLRQEHYMEARFEVPPDQQRHLVDLLRESDGAKFRLPDALVSSFVHAAYLGQLDVDPLGEVPGSQNDRRSWHFYGQQIASGDAKLAQVSLTGRSEVAGGQRWDAFRSDGRLWNHAVKLNWQGYFDFNGDQITRVELLAEGHEKLSWGNALLQLKESGGVQHLMAGHPIDLDCRVVYGLTARPAATDEISDGDRSGEKN